MRRLLLGVCSVSALALAVCTAPGCGSDSGASMFDGGSSGSAGEGGCVGLACPSPDGGGPCLGLQCQQQEGANCDNGGKTTLTGTVFDPAGKVPLYNATVYIPLSNDEPLADLPEGASTCDRCDANVSGKPIAITSTDTSGHFTIDNAPSEFGVAGSDARVHLYAGGGFTQGTFKAASSQFASALNGGVTFPSATPLWSAAANLQKYDVVLLACEGDENIATKPDPAKAALYDYAKTGGRIFASHYHYAWFSKSPDPIVSGVASWPPPDGTGFNERTPPAVPSDPATTAVNATISSQFPKAVAMNDWLTRQQALASGKLPIFDARHNIDSVSASSLSWITVANPNVASPNNLPTEYMSFNTPIGAAEDAVCGRVVVSDIHVAAGQQGGTSDDPQAAFPDGCKTTDLSPQQKALEFMLFDLSSCIQKDDAPVEQPR